MHVFCSNLAKFVELFLFPKFRWFLFLQFNSFIICSTFFSLSLSPRVSVSTKLHAFARKFVSMFDPIDHSFNLNLARRFTPLAFPNRHRYSVYYYNVGRGTMCAITIYYVFIVWILVLALPALPSSPMRVSFVSIEHSFTLFTHAHTHYFPIGFLRLFFFLCICSLVHLIFSWFLVVLFPQQILIWLFSLDLFIFSLSFSCYIALHSLSSHIFLVIFPLLLLLLLFSIVSTINLSAEI